MKTSRLIIAFSLAALLAVSAGEQWRTFSNADETKSFEGSLVAYSEKAGKVKIRLKNGKQAVLALEKLSEKDVKWLKETGVWQLRVTGLDVKLKRDKLSDEAITDQGAGSTRSIRVRKEGYEILITNPGKEDVEGLECDYVFYARKRMADETEVESHKGTFIVTLIEPGEEFASVTDHIALDVSERLLGMVLYIKHGKKIIRTVETSSGIAKRLDAKIAKQRR
jgi:hypothetical protein